MRPSSRSFSEIGDGFGRQGGEIMQLSLDILGDPLWSYAYAGTLRPVVKGIVLHQSGALPEEDITVFPRLTFEFPLPEEVAKPWEGLLRPIEARGQHIGEPIVWERIDLDLNYQILARLQERVVGKVRVEIVDAGSGDVLFEDAKTLALLAPNQWQFEANYHDVLAVFVLPSDPYVHDVLLRARDILEARTGVSSTEGYQGETSPALDDRPLNEKSRAYHIAHAIYDAMSAMGYAYSNPPGLLDELAAQRVRTPSQIRNENCATCLDSSVLMAACFAQAGLEPVLFLTRGHAFAGYFTGAPLLDAAGQLVRDASGEIYGDHAVSRLMSNLGTILRRDDDYGIIQELLRNGYIQPIETTSTTTGLFRPFHEACSRQNNFSIADDEALESVILVANAWRTGLTPPVTLADVPLHDFGRERVPSDRPEPTIDDPDSDDPNFEQPAADRSLPPRVRQWMASLLDLSLRNPLLKVKPAQVLEFDVPSTLLGAVDDALYTPKKRLEIVSPSALPFEWVHQGATEGDFKEWMGSKIRLLFPSFTSLNGIQRNAETFLKDVRGDTDDPIRSPGTLSQADVREIRADRNHPVHAMSDAAIIKTIREGEFERLNSALKASVTKVQTKAREVMLSTGTNSLYLALGTLTWTESSDFRGKRNAVQWRAPLYLYPVVLEGGKGSPYTIRLDPNGEATPNYCLHEKLKRAPYNLDLQELVNPVYDDTGLDFNKMVLAIRRRLREAKLDNFAIQPCAILGVFDYSTFRLWKDLKDSWKQMSDISPATKHLMYTPNNPFTDDPPQPEPRLEPYLPIAADDSQRAAVQWALDGRSFRLEGPPGTGKSQTITNLLASCIANNRKVLFVAEKQTALNAVKERLDEAGLGHYCLNLHAKGDSDTRLRKNISEALTTSLAQRIDPEDSAWQDLHFKISKEQEALDRYQASLHGTADRLSAWQANEERLALGSGPMIELPRSFVDGFEERWPAFQETSALIDQAIDLVGDPTAHRWGLIDGCRIPEEHYAAVTQALHAVLASCTAVAAKGPAWVELVEQVGASRYEELAAAVAMSAQGRLQDLDAVKSAADAGEQLLAVSGRDTTLDEVVECCTDLATRLTPHLASVSAGFIEHDATVATVRTQLARLDAAVTSAEFLEVAEAWQTLSDRAAGRLDPAWADELFGRSDLQPIERAFDEFSSAETRRNIDAFVAEARALEANVRAHAPNVAATLLGRADLINVTVYATDAESAGVLSRKKKTRALRDLLGTDAVTADDRLLLLSVKEMLALAATAAVIQARAVSDHPEVATGSFRPWVPEDVDAFVKAIRDVEVRRLAEATQLDGAPTDEGTLTALLQVAIDLAPIARACVDLLRSNLPEDFEPSYRPWNATEVERLRTAVRARYTKAIREALGGHALATGDEQLVAAVRAWVEAVAEIDDLRRRVTVELCPGYPASLRPWEASDIDEVVTARQSLLRVGSLLRDERIAAALSAALATAPAASDSTLVQDFAAAWTSFEECFVLTTTSRQRWRGDRSTVDAVLADFPGLILDGGDTNRYLELTRWLSLLDAVKMLAVVGLEDLGPVVMSGAMTAEELASATRRSAIDMALRMRLEEGNLDRFDRKVHERRIREFERNLKESQTLLKKRIPGLVNRRRAARALPSGNDVGATQALLRNLKPVRGAKTPIRDLISKYGNALADAMPCFLMSPDSVAALLPVGAISFDLVVFDEASQVRTSHAVGALGRGSAGIVVGDSRQMPPSNAFSSNAGTFVEDDDIEDDEEPELVDDSDLAEEGSIEAILRPEAAPDAESILSEFYDSEFPHLQLLCHYRSKDELLIAFSNTNIYDTPMLTFPSTKGLESEALRFVHVPDGFFQRDKKAPPHDFPNSQMKVPSLRTNLREAEEVTDETLRRLADPVRRALRDADPERKAESIIIVTFNTQQAKLIEAMLRERNADLFEEATSEGEPDELTGKRTAPQLKIRNLESVQGDEAETVIFSLAFSRTLNGTFPLNFGPVTQPGGDRRLNVAVTRAQREMIVFGSFLPEEMSSGNKVLSDQARMVQRFLALALHGPSRAADVGVNVARSRHIAEISLALRERGHLTETQLGLSSLRVDIAVRREGSPHWELAVMVDGVCWSERGSAFQRELLPRQILPALGWTNVVRVWLPTWLNDRDEILAEIDAALEGQAVNHDDEVDTDPDSGSPTVEEEVEREVMPVQPVEHKQRFFTEYVPFQVEVVGDSYCLDDADRDPQQRRVIEEIIGGVVAAEAPVHAERLAKLVCYSLGMERVPAARVAQVLALVPPSLLVNDEVGTFAWPSDTDRSTWRMYRTSLSRAEREPNQIPEIEYTNALIDIVDKAHMLELDVALKEVCRVFGFQRVTPKVRVALESSFARAVEQGKVRLVDGEYHPT
jgi:hypothetical protein